jgi:N4-gp56 family major capsid protein
MADVATKFSTLSNDAPNVYIARETYKVAERNLVLNKAGKSYDLPQRMGKTLRVVRHKRLALPTAVLTEGTPPDAVALAIENVDVTVEQWGIVVLLTDVAMITTTHPALQVAIERTGMAMSELLERETANMLLGGTNVIYGGAAVARSGLAASDKMTTTIALKATTSLRARGAIAVEGGLYMGVIAPQIEADLLAADTTFQQASNYANVRRLEVGEIGVWMGVRWLRGNFLPIFRGAPAPDTGAATAYKPQITAVDGGGTITSSTNFKFAVVYKDANSGYERRITQASANISSAATGNNESFTVTVAASDLTNYVYDVYMSAAGGSGSLFKVKENQTGTSVTITAVPAGTEATSPVAPAANVEVFVGWVFGKEAFGRVELNGMSLQSYLTEPGASFSNPLAQGRKCGSKVMWKSFIIDNSYFTRIEVGSAFSAELPA